MESSNIAVAPQTPSIALSAADFDSLVDKLATLSRNHLLYFRIEVGRAVAETFFAGDLQAYFDRDHTKTASLRKFASERKDSLEAIGLSEQLVRQCILVYLTVADLPPELVQRLVFSHVVELSRVEDMAMRRVLAHASVDNRWSLQALRDAVLSARSGRWIDGDPVKPGLQPTAPVVAEAEAKKPQAGRVVSRFEKTTAALDDLVAQWEQVEVAAMEAPFTIFGRTETISRSLRKTSIAAAP